MALHDSDLRIDPASEVAKMLAGRWAWLARLMVGKQPVGDVKIEGFSVRFRSTDWMVVVMGLNLVTLKRVVCFGRGERVYEALRNATTSINKDAWKPDQYRQDELL